MLIRAALLALLASSSANAAMVDVQVRGAGGQPVMDAVVMLVSAHPAPGPIRFPWPYVIKQQDISFQPHVLIVPVGTQVAFPNMDRVRHHVYSFSKAKKFELRLYGHDETRTVVFDKAGVIAIGCNIHDTMSGFIIAVDTPYAAKTDAGGHAVMADVPPGGATLRVWYPDVRTPGNQISQTVTVPAGGLNTTVSIGS